MPDPCDESAFRESILQGRPKTEREASLLRLYVELIRIRKKIRSVRSVDKEISWRCLTKNIPPSL
jgi:hypothetical protein